MDLKTGIVLKNRYRVVKQLDDTSYRAWDTSLEQARILQLLSTDASSRPMQLAQLHHSHLPRINDVLMVEGKQMLVVDYVAGQSVRERMSERGQPIERARAIHWVNQIGDALRYLHQKGMAHGDVSADTIQITAAQDAILTNFASEDGLRTDDVRGLAATLYMMLTAQPASKTPPSTHNSAIDDTTESAIMTGLAGRFSKVDDLLAALNPVQPSSEQTLPKLSGDATTILPPLSAMQTMGGQQPVRQDQTMILDGSTASGQQAKVKSLPDRPKSRSRLPLIAGLLGVLMLLGVISFALFSGNADEEPAQNTPEPDDNAVVVADDPTEPPPTDDDVNGNDSDEPKDEPTATVISTQAPLSQLSDEETPPPDSGNNVPVGAIISGAAGDFEELLGGIQGYDENEYGRFAGVSLDEQNGTLYVADVRNGVMAVDLMDRTAEYVDFGLPTITIEHVMALGNETLVLVSPRGNIGYVANYDTWQILGRFGNEDTGEGALSKIKGAAVGFDGSIYILDETDDDIDQIKLYDATDGSFQRTILIGEASIYAKSLTLDEDNNFYIPSSDTISKYDNDGKLIAVLGKEALREVSPREYSSASPNRLTIARDGSIVIATDDAGIVVLDADGNLQSQFGEVVNSCYSEDVVDQGTVCDPESIVVSSDGSTVIFTDNTGDYSTITALITGD